MQGAAKLSKRVCIPCLQLSVRGLSWGRKGCAFLGLHIADVEPVHGLQGKQ